MEISCFFYDMVVPFFWILIMGTYAYVAIKHCIHDHSSMEYKQLLDTTQPIGKTKFCRFFNYLGRNEILVRERTSIAKIFQYCFAFVICYTPEALPFQNYRIWWGFAVFLAGLHGFVNAFIYGFSVEFVSYAKQAMQRRGTVPQRYNPAIVLSTQ